MISQLLIFLFVWFSIFFIHELMHCLEAWRQGAEHVGIYPEFSPVPTMYMQYIGDYIPNPVMVHFAGGVYTSIICFFFAFFTSGIYQFCFLTLGWVQLCYGIFEGFFIGRLSNRMYTIVRYSLYVSVVLVCIWLFYPVVV